MLGVKSAGVIIRMELQLICCCSFFLVASAFVIAMELTCWEDSEVSSGYPETRMILADTTPKPKQKPHHPARRPDSTNQEGVYRRCSDGSLLCYVRISYEFLDLTVVRRMKHGAPVICPVGYDPSQATVDCRSMTKHINCTVRSNYCAVQRHNSCGTSYDIVSKRSRFPRCSASDKTDQSRVSCGAEKIIPASQYGDDFSSCCNVTTIYENRDGKFTRCSLLQAGQTPQCPPGYTEEYHRCVGSDQCSGSDRGDIDIEHCSHPGLELEITCRLENANC